MIQEFLIKFCIAETPAGVYSPMNSNSHEMLFKVTKNWRFTKPTKISKTQQIPNYTKF